MEKREGKIGKIISFKLLQPKGKIGKIVSFKILKERRKKWQ